MSLLAKALEEMKTLRPIAEEDLDTLEVENPMVRATMGVRRGRQNAAKEKMKTLKREYSDALLRSAVFILSVGESASEFNEAVTSDGSVLGVSAESLHEDLAARVHPTLYAGKDPGANLFDVVGRHLEDKARELGISEYPQLIFKNAYRRQINSQADFVELLKIAMTEQVGGELVGINAVRALTDKAIEKDHAKSVTPILLTTSDQKFAVELIAHLERLTPRVFLVVAGKAPKQLKSMQGAIVVSKVSQESAHEALASIQNNLKK